MSDPSESEIVKLCHDPKSHTLLSHPKCGSKVVHLHEYHDRVVKFSSRVTRHEAQSQRLARAKVDLQKVYVPEVYGFFERNGIGYLVMEFVKSEKHLHLDSSRREVLKSAVQHLHSIKQDAVGLIGPLGGGAPAGLLFFKAFEDSFDSKKKVEGYFKLWNDQHGPNLPQFDWVLDHLDWAPRNILWRKAGPLCLLDWASAGVYPRLLEHCTLAITNNDDSDFEDAVKSSIKLSKAEEKAYDIVLAAYDNSQRYRYP